MTTLDLWPYCECSGLIDRDLARSIREWALTGSGSCPPEMTEAELNSYSQRQLMQMYIQRGIVPTIEEVLKRQRTPEKAQQRQKLFWIPESFTAYRLIRGRPNGPHTASPNQANAALGPPSTEAPLA
jgi:hypothetical protein